jgi:hypothetical protein
MKVKEIRLRLTSDNLRRREDESSTGQIGELRGL